MIKEFKEFAFKGNMVDMAVAVVIGGAFAAVAKSLVEDIIMPPIAAATGGIDFSNKFSILKEGKTPPPYETLEAAKKAGAVVLSYGNFITVGISFLLVTLAIFVVVKMIQKAKGEPKPEAPAGPTDVELLTEIRDLMKRQAKTSPKAD